MGIQGLLPFLKKCSRPANLAEFKGKTAAVDAYCWLHKGAFSCAEKLVKGEATDGYIVYVMKQVNLLLSFNIKPILVFDGCHLPAKAGTETKRRENREKNRRKAKELLREGKLKEARECFQRCVDVTHTMAHEVIKACRDRNIDTIVAPYEADAQLAYLSHCGVADVVITEDSDLVLFGCEKIIFKMDNNGGGNLVLKEKLHLAMNIPRDKFDFCKFRNMCVLSGCDYLPSLHGIGLAKACRFFIVTSNPDIFTALCKLPSHLKMPHLEVTLEYRRGFMRAIDTVLHQLVFDPFTRTLKPLTPYPDGVTAEDMPYCGKFIGHNLALQIALGNVDVNTKEYIDNFDPRKFKRREVKSTSWHQKGNGVSKHPSIWDPDFDNLVQVQNQKEESKQRELEGITMRGRQCTVKVPSLKRKITDAVQTENSDVSEDYLQTFYTSKKVKSSPDNQPQHVDSQQATEQDVSSHMKDSHESGSTLPSHASEIRDFVQPIPKEVDTALGNNEIEDSFFDIVENSVDIDKNSLDIGQHTADIHKNSLDVNKNSSDIDKSSVDTDKVSVNIKDYSADNKDNTVDTDSPPSKNNSVNTSQEEIGEKSLILKSPTRNPFAKKLMTSPDSENRNPQKVGKFSALFKFSKSPRKVVVRSRFFKPANETREEEIKEIQLERNIESEKNASTKRQQFVKSPLKPKNDEISPAKSKERVLSKGSFNWNGRLAQMYAFEKKPSPSIQYTRNVNHNPSTSRSSDSDFYDTPPSSQNQVSKPAPCLLFEEDKGENGNRPSLHSPSPKKSLNGNTIIPLTPPHDDSFNSSFKTPMSGFHRDRLSSSQKKQPLAKCRVSGLRKSTPTTSKQKQLSLKDMFSFKKDVDKIPISTLERS